VDQPNGPVLVQYQLNNYILANMALPGKLVLCGCCSVRGRLLHLSSATNSCIAGVCYNLKRLVRIRHDQLSRVASHL
jgi:hypothetical protein